MRAATLVLCFLGAGFAGGGAAVLLLRPADPAAPPPAPAPAAAPGPGAAHPDGDPARSPGPVLVPEGPGTTGPAGPAFDDDLEREMAREAEAEAEARDRTLRFAEEARRRGRVRRREEEDADPVLSEHEMAAHCEETRRDAAWLLADDELRRSRFGAVAGMVTHPSGLDPVCSVAVESLDRPDLPDRSRLRDVDVGAWRLEGVPPGRYRVRAARDGGLATYSEPLVVVAGAVTDAGVLRLRDAGRIAGVVRGAGGREVEARVWLSGRDPESLEPRTAGAVSARGREGFSLAPEETGAFRLFVAGEEGWAVHRGSTDAAGRAWVEIPLQAWGTVVVEGGAGARVAGVGVVVPATGEWPDAAEDWAPAPTRDRRLLPAGAWSLEVRLRRADGSRYAVERKVVVEPGKVVRVRAE